jgi:hypothetical protein
MTVPLNEGELNLIVDALQHDGAAGRLRDKLLIELATCGSGYSEDTRRRAQEILIPLIKSVEGVHFNGFDNNAIKIRFYSDHLMGGPECNEIAERVFTACRQSKDPAVLAYMQTITSCSITKA